MQRSTAHGLAVLLGPVAYLGWLGFHGHGLVGGGDGTPAPWQVAGAAITFLVCCFGLGRVWGTRPLLIGLFAGLALTAVATVDWATRRDAGTGLILEGVVPMAVIAPLIGLGAAVAGRRSRYS